MADQCDSERSRSAEEVLKTELIVNQALIDILINKQLISEEELVTAIRKIRLEQKKKIIDSKNIVRLKG